MERNNLGNERLIAPTDFTAPVASNLMPPSHFASSAKFAGPNRIPSTIGTTQSLRRVNQGVTSGDPASSKPWLALSQPQQEIMKGRRENQRIKMLHHDSARGSSPVDAVSDLLRSRWNEGREQWSSGCESEWCTEAGKCKTETERLKMQLEAPKNTAQGHRGETRDRDSIMNRQRSELESLQEELREAKAELSQVRVQLAQNDKLERLRGESAAEDTAKLKKDLEKSMEEAREWALKAEMCRLKAEKEAKQQSRRLSEQLGEMQTKQETELQLLNAAHQAELASSRKTNSELQDRLQSMTSEILQLRSTVNEVSSKRNALEERLSQMGQAFETQSATLQSLRNYIGELAPEKGEKEQLRDAVERLKREKTALQMTAELLTVRLNSVNEILSLQEDKMVHKTSADPLVKNQPAGLQVLQLWREKVFKLCVQLRTKDIELREEKDKLLSKVASIDQHLQQEQHRVCVLQHSLDDKVAELDMARVEQETLKQDVFQAHRENSQLKLQKQKVEAELQTVSEAVHKFRLAFESKVAEVGSAQARLNVLTQRLTFAKGRVETVQGLILRKVALQKVQQASKQPQQDANSVPNLQAELRSACEERDKLAQELKRTPELIDKSLAQLREQYETSLKRQQQELEQSWAAAREAAAGREEAEQRLQQIQAQLDESRVNLESASAELLILQESSRRALQERVSEIEDRCAQKLREMELQVNTAKREHTKAVMILRQFEKARRQDEIRAQQPCKEREIQDKILKEKERDKKLLFATVVEGGPTSGCTSTRAALLRNPAAPQETSSEGRCHDGAKTQLPARSERLRSVLEDLRSLSTAVVNSSEDSAEEEEEEDRVMAPDHPQADLT